MATEIDPADSPHLVVDGEGAFEYRDLETGIAKDLQHDL